ncbi:MAG: pectinesterase family protein [Breznakibacter sp.]
MKTILLSWLLFTAILPIKAYDIVVAKDGSGNFTTVQEAILSVRDYTPVPKTIFIKNGTYNEKVVIPANKCDISLIGESKEGTIITWDDHANINKMGTFKTYTLKVEGNNILIENLSVENNAPQLGQAVALHVEGHKVVVRNCRLLGNQDTLFTGNDYSFQYYENCYIEGTTDFIFGPATCWFERCEIHSKRDSYITAASTPATKKYGYVFNNCKLTAGNDVTKVYLGRPWRAYAATVFMNCELGSHILPEGWENWRNPENEKTARYAEYKNTGPGADRSKRVAWSHELTQKEAKLYTQKLVFDGWELFEKK